MFAKSVTVTPDKTEAEDDQLATLFRATDRSFYNTYNSTLLWKKVKYLIVLYKGGIKTSKPSCYYLHTSEQAAT